MSNEKIPSPIAGGREGAHQLFIAGYLRTGNKRLAYKTAYPDIADGDSLRVASNRLYRQLKSQIESLEAHATELAIQEMMTDAKERIKTEICNMQQRREVLADIILGRMKVTRHIRLKDRVVEVEETVSPGVIIRAIDLDSRLAANKYKEKGIEYKKPAETITPLSAVIAAQSADADALLPLEERLKKYPYSHEYWKGKNIRLYGADVQKYGFDILEEGVPYLKGELTEAYKEIRLQRDIEDFRQRFPEQAKELFDNKPVKHSGAEKSSTEEKTETTGNNQLPAIAPVAPASPDLWEQYLKLDSNTRALHPQDRKQKETWFRAIPEKQQLRLIEFYRKTG